MARRTKQQAVLEWLQTGAGITSMEAFKGYDIASENVKVRDRFGGTTTVSRYYLKGSPKPYVENPL